MPGLKARPTYVGRTFRSASKLASKILLADSPARLLACCLVSAALPLAQAQTNIDVHRTVYLTARHQTGAYVTGLTAADLTVKEGGRERQVVQVEPAAADLKICLAIDQGLALDDVARRALSTFVQQLQGTAEVAVTLAGHGNATLVDYTPDLASLLKAISALPMRAKSGGNLVESLYELVKGQRAHEGRRAIVLLATETPERTTVTANGVLDQLRDTGVVLYVVTLVGPAGTVPMTPEMAHLDMVEEVERDRALNDGTRQSGGLRLPSLRIDDFATALGRIRGELQHQYVVTYVIPAGSKSDGRLSIASKRKGITVRAPTLVRKI